VDANNKMLDVLDARWAMLIKISSNKKFLEEQLYNHEFSRLFFNDLVYDETKHYSKHNRQLLINCLFDFIFKDIVNKHLTQDNVREARQYMEIERKNFLKFCELEYGPSTLPKSKCQRINNDDGDDIIKQTSSAPSCLDANMIDQESTPNETIEETDTHDPMKTDSDVPTASATCSINNDNQMALIDQKSTPNETKEETDSHVPAKTVLIDNESISAEKKVKSGINSCRDKVGISSDLKAPP